MIEKAKNMKNQKMSKERGLHISFTQKQYMLKMFEDTYKKHIENVTYQNCKDLITKVLNIREWAQSTIIYGF